MLTVTLVPSHCFCVCGRQPLQISAGQIDLTNSIITGGALTIHVAGPFSIASLSVVKFSSSCAIYADTFSLSNNLIEVRVWEA